MGYYRPQGDYYAGYRGDPGIGSFFRGLVTKAISFIPGVGPVASNVLDKVLPGGARTFPGTVIPAAATISAAAGGAVQAVKSAIVKHPVLSAAGAAGALGGVMGAGAEMIASRGGCGVGRHQRRPLKKCGTVLKSGRCGKCYRSMNVCNPHALRRAIRRTRGFAKLAMKTIHIVHPKKKGRFGGFKRRRKS